MHDIPMLTFVRKLTYNCVHIPQTIMLNYTICIFLVGENNCSRFRPELFLEPVHTSSRICYPLLLRCADGEKEDN